MMKPKRCLNCNNIFDRPFRSKDSKWKVSWYYYKRMKLCSNKCSGEWRSKNNTGENNANYRGGKNKCIDCGKRISVRNTTYLRCRKCCSKFYIGENHPSWKGNKVGYIGIHHWVRKLFPKPMKCSTCGKKGKYIYFKEKNGKDRKLWSIHIANKSGKYLRDLSDWIGLCAKCHKIYDTKQLKRG